MATFPTLVTGFEPFAGLDRNPSDEVARRLDGRTVGGAPVVARILPVSLERYRAVLAAEVEEVRPGLVIALGLAQGEASIRLERIGVNLADFEIADNDGALAADRPVEPGGPQARLSTIPVSAIEAALWPRESPLTAPPPRAPICATPASTACSDWRKPRILPLPAGSSICPTCPSRWRA
jgi:pyroglutamyl-peptidase I